MAYSGSHPWDSSYYDYSNNAGNWRSAEQHSHNEQYNPLYPSFNGTSNFYSSSAQTYDAAPYHPTTASHNTFTRIPKIKRHRPHGVKRKEQTWPNNKFHLITIGSDSTDPKPQSSKIAEAAPLSTVKVARGNTKNKRGGEGIRRMPNFRLQGNSWDTNGIPNQGGPGGRSGTGGNSRGRGRGRGGSTRGGRFQGPPKPTNSKDDIKFVHLPDDAPAITLNASSANIVAFHGFDSVFTTQHNFPVLIDGKIYSSCDHYYQICKVNDLTGTSSDRLNKGVRDESGKLIVDSDVREKMSHSAIAKDVIKAAGIGKDKVDEWRNTKGLSAVQKALAAKATQSAHLREALKETGDQILVHAFPRDSIYGTGCNAPAIRKWLDDLEKSGIKTLKIPATFPLNETTVQHCPVFAQGRNILGVILMQLRAKIRSDGVEIVDMSKVYDALRTHPSSSEPVDANML
uniref:DUF1768 domain-containing protein n=1 Tax=Caenorhabditis tropicalis TaxID=1561998 RepID=A0A1I7U9U9_9PELO